MTSNRKHSILGLIPLFEVMERAGLDPELLLTRHGIDLSNLSGTALIDQAVEQDIIRDALALSDDPLLGLKVGSRSTFASFGTFALLVMTAPTFREAVQTSVQFQALSLLLTHCSLHFDQAFFELRYALPDAAPEILPYVADRDFAGTVMFISELVNDPGAYPMTAGVARPMPGLELRAAYRRIAPLNLQFDQPYSWFRLPNRLLTEPLKHGNRLAHKLYRVQAQELLRRFYPGADDIVSQVRQIIAGYDGHSPTAKEVAAMAGMSERTFRRKLDDVGRSYRGLLDAHRKKRALALLMTENKSVAELAEALGYTEPASFLRAFRRWTGMTPKHYRRARKDGLSGVPAM